MAADTRTSKRPRRSTTLSSEECTRRVLSLLLDVSNRVLVLQGAGISGAAGIPDFRSKGRGLYTNTSIASTFTTLPTGWKPMCLFNKRKFDINPKPLTTLLQRLRELDAKPTCAHKLSDYLARNKRLTRCYTQNIDVLELHSDLTSLCEDNVCFLHGRIPSPSTLTAQSIVDSICFIGQTVDIPHLTRDMDDASVLLVLGTSLAAATASGIVADFRGHRVLVTNDATQGLVPRRTGDLRDHHSDRHLDHHSDHRDGRISTPPCDIVLRMDVQEFAEQALHTLSSSE